MIAPIAHRDTPEERATGAPIAREAADDASDDADEPVWKALSNSLRRRMLDELRTGPLKTGDLASRFDVSRHVVMQHLQVLRDAELVRTVRQGRVRINYLNPVPIQHIHQRWVSQYQGLWSEALLGLKAHVETTANEPDQDTHDQDMHDQRGEDVG